MRVWSALIVALALAVAVFGHRAVREEHACFLHCHGELPRARRTLGWPFPYWERTEVPGDPPRVVSTRFVPLGLVGDTLVFGLFTCGIAIAAAALGRRQK